MRNVASKVESVTNFLVTFPCDVPHCYMIQFRNEVAPYKIEGIATLLNYEWLILKHGFHCFQCKVTDDSFPTIKGAHLLDSYFNKFCSI